MKSYIKWVILLFNLFAWIGASAADNTVYGRVVNEADSVAIANVKCSLFRDNMLITSTSTDDEGLFRFDYKSNASYQIVFAYEGYEETEIRFSGFKGVRNLGLIAMVKPTILDEVTVAGKSRIERLGKLYVTPSKFQVNASNSSFDLLSKLNLPGLRIDAMSDNLSVSNGQVMLYVDGVPTSAMYLKTLKASYVATVEYQDRLPMKYGGGEGGVINIVLKPRDDGGSLYLGAGIVPYMKSDNGTVSFEYHRGSSELGLLYNISFNDYKHQSRSETNEYISSQSSIKESSLSNENDYSLRNTVQLSYTYRHSQNTIFSTFIQLFNRHDKTCMDGSVYDTENGKLLIHGYSEDKYLMPARLNLFLKKSMGRHGLELMFDGSYSHQNVENRQYFTFANGSVSGLNNDAKGDNFGFRFDGYYNFRIDDTSSLEASYYGKFRFNTNRYDNDASIENQSAGDHYLNVNYSKIFGKFELQISPGLTILVNGNKFKDTDLTNVYINPVGRLNLGYRISETFRCDGLLSVGRRTPEMVEYTDHIRQVNLYLYKAGNPDLKGQKQIYGSLSLNYFKGKFNGRAYVGYDYGINPFYNSVICLGDNYFLCKPVNYKHNKSLFLYIDLGANNLWDRLGYLVSVGYQCLEAKGEAFNNRINQLSLYAQIYFNWRNFTAQYQLKLGNESLAGPIVTASPLSNILSLSYRFNSHWNLTLSTAYFLQSGVVTSRVYNNQKAYVNSVKVICPEYRSFTRLTISYNTNFGSRKNVKLQRRLSGESGGGSLQQ